MRMRGYMYTRLQVHTYISAQLSPPAAPPAMGYRCVCTTGTVQNKAGVQSKSRRKKLFSDMSLAPFAAVKMTARGVQSLTAPPTNYQSGGLWQHMVSPSPLPPKAIHITPVPLQTRTYSARAVCRGGAHGGLDGAHTPSHTPPHRRPLCTPGTAKRPPPAPPCPGGHSMPQVPPHGAEAPPPVAQRGRRSQCHSVGAPGVRAAKPRCFLGPDGALGGTTWGTGHQKRTGGGGAQATCVLGACPHRTAAGLSAQAVHLQGRQVDGGGTGGGHAAAVRVGCIGIHRGLRRLFTARATMAYTHRPGTRDIGLKRSCETGESVGEAVKEGTEWQGEGPTPTQDVPTGCPGAGHKGAEHLPYLWPRCS